MPRERHMQRFCPACAQPRRFVKPGVSHLIHAVVTLFLCGLWLPVWIVAALRNSFKPYRCVQCGSISRPNAGTRVLLAATACAGLLLWGIALFLGLGRIFVHEAVPTAPVQQKPVSTSPIIDAETTPAPIIPPPTNVAKEAAPAHLAPVETNAFDSATALAAATAARQKTATADATFKFHHEEALAGKPGSMYRLGQLYLTGTGCEANTNTARIWLEKAAALGNEDAQQELEKLK